jgi:hypothetical protein
MAIAFSSTVCKIVLMVAVALVALFPTSELPLFMQDCFNFTSGMIEMLFLLAGYSHIDDGIAGKAVKYGMCQAQCLEI